jgi:hypothetical protein
LAVNNRFPFGFGCTNLSLNLIKFVNFRDPATVTPIRIITVVSKKSQTVIRASDNYFRMMDVITKHPRVVVV